MKRLLLASCLLLPSNLWAEDVDVFSHGANSIISINPDPSLIIHNGKIIVTIHPDGTVTHTGTLEESAEAFWNQVSLTFRLNCIRVNK